MSGPRILLVIGGGIAAYKACELVRLIRKHGGSVTCVLTEGGAQFVTEMSLAALSERPVHTTLWDLRNEVEMGHIQLSREADLVVVCPATANLMAHMAHGIADDLATTLLLATDKPVMAVPAMNVRMWQHAATQANVAALRDAGVLVLDPDEGAMACGEFGPGRLPEPEAIWAHIAALFSGPDALPIMGMAPGEWTAPPTALRAGAPYLLPEPELEYEEGAEGAEGTSGGEEPSGKHSGRFSSLLGGLIARSTKNRALSLDDEDLPGEFGPDLGDEELSFDEAFLASNPDFVPPVEIPPPGLLPQPGLLQPGAGSLLGVKGRARAAPPTDPQAINHLVTGSRAAPPEPIAGDVQPVFVDPTEMLPVDGPLSGKHVLITAGPTHEPIDPVRYIANRSSGKQGYAIAAAAAQMGARVTLVSGPVTLPTPPGVDRIDVESARDMAAAVKSALPADCAIMVAAVADWRTKDFATGKIKKRGSAPPVLMLTENPDILATVASQTTKPRLLIGFAAETDDLLKNATEKRTRKGADWIVANDVSGDVMGGGRNTVHIVTRKGIETLPEMAKQDVAHALMERIAHEFEQLDA
ncbi:MAG: bifunctional phosphopantothenoylcysteine decarboxylase/phosphopantothenate synthase [Novosphingobium sp.]